MDQHRFPDRSDHSDLDSVLAWVEATLTPGTAQKLPAGMEKTLAAYILDQQAEIRRLREEAEYLRQERKVGAPESAPSEDQLKTALEHSGIMLAAIGPDLRYTWAFSPPLNDPAIPFSIVGRRDDEIIDNEEMREQVRLKQQVLDTGRGVRARLAIPFPDGKKIFDVSLEPHPDSSGKISEIVLASREVTLQVAAEEALRLTRDRLLKAEEVANAGHWELHTDTGEIYASEGALRIYGINENEVSYKTGMELALPEYLPLFNKTIQALTEQGGIHKLEYKIKRKSDGKILDLHTVTESDPARRVIFGTLLDITERKQAEALMQASERKYRQIVDTAQEGIWLTDPAGITTYVNQRMAVLLGYQADEMVGLSMFSFLDDNNRKGAQRYYLRLMQGHKERHDVLFHKKDGSLLWSIVSASPMISENGEILGALSLITDITARKEIEEELVRSEKHYRYLFENSSIAIWELDFSAVRAHVEHLRQNGVTDFQTHFENNPEDVLYCASLTRILDINQKSVVLLQAFGKDDIYYNISHCILPDTFLGFQKVIAGLAMGKNLVELEIPVQTFEGERILLACSYFVLPGYEGLLSKVLVSFIDITQRTNAEKALQDSYHKLELLFDFIPVGLSVLDTRQKIVKTNLAFGEILGLTADDMLQNLHNNRRYFRRDGTLMQMEEFPSTRVQRGEERALHVVIGVEKENQELIWVDTSAVACPFSDWNILIVMEDITQQIESVRRNDELLDQLSLQNEEQQSVINLAASLRKAQTLNDVHTIIARMTMDLFKADAAALMLQEEGTFTIAACAGRWESTAGMRHPGDIPLFQHILGSGRAQYISNTTGMPGVTGGENLAMMQGLTASAVAPLIVGEVPIGLLMMGSYSEADTFEKQLNLLTTIAEIAAITIQRMTFTAKMEQVVARRTGELTALYNVISVAGQPWDLRNRLESALDQVLESLNCQLGMVYFVDTEHRLELMAQKNLPDYWKNALVDVNVDEMWEGWVLEHGEALIIPNIYEDPRCLLPPETRQGRQFVYIGVPVFIREIPKGVVSILREGPQIFSIDEITFITALVNHIGVLIENAGLIEKAEQAILLEERSRLARELHDSVSQTLYSASLFAEAAADHAEQGNLTLVKEHLARLTEIARQALKEMRLLVYELRPPVLEQEGLVAALRQRLELVENRVAIHTHLTTNLLMKLENAIEEALYWTAIEALNNITRHAQASEINLDIHIDRKQVKLSIQDDGVGFDQNDPFRQGGLGIKNMRERLGNENGFLSILSTPGSGTKITATIPLDAGRSE